jgi:hypothetical protein
MKLSIKAMALTSGLLWGGAVLCVATANCVEPRYGKKFLGILESIYPGYHVHPEPASVALGTAYALVDGAAGGAICAWLYNQLAACESKSGH